MIWIGIVSCLLSCYFAACHVALKTFSRSRLTDLLEEKGKSARTRLVENGKLARLLLMTGTIRTCLNLLVLLVTLYMVEIRLGGVNRIWLFLIAFLIAGAAVSIFSVAIPISWAHYRRERLLAWSLPVLNVCLVVFGPVTLVLHLFDPVIRRISGVDLNGDDENDISEEVLSIVEDHDDGANVDDVQKEMLEAVFDLAMTTAGEIMTPRTDVKGIEVDADLEHVKEAIIECGHSRIPVYEQSLDHILGILYAKDMIRFVRAKDSSDFDIRQVMRKAFMVPESKSVRELLAEFKARKIHMAIVLDEYGGTAGLVTIEDILEEIVGEIQDEYELAQRLPGIKRIDDLTVEVDARVYIDDLNDKLDVELPEDEDYDTVGGFVFATLGHIPVTGESFDFDGLNITVTAAEETKVLQVSIRKVQTEPASSHTENE